MAALDSLLLSQPLTGPLYLGMRSDGVKRVQARLGALTPGSQLNPDGAFGAKTDRAVREFQTKNRLKADGIVGPLTAAALGFTNYQRGAPPAPPQLPPRPGGVPGGPLPTPPQAVDDSPLGQLADVFMTQIALAAHEVANAFERIAEITGDDVIPACRDLRNEARVIGRDTRDNIIQAVRAGNAQAVAQILRNAKVRGQNMIERFLDRIMRIGLALLGVVQAVASRIRTMINLVFDRAINVALGIGGTVVALAREVSGAIYDVVNGVIGIARQLT